MSHYQTWRILEKSSNLNKVECKLFFLLIRETRFLSSNLNKVECK